MTSDYSKIKQSLLDKRYIQGLNATPFYMSACAWSCFTMQKDLGFSHKRMLFNYKGEYGEMQYFQDDLDNIWNIVKQKLEEDPSYLHKIKDRYHNNFRSHLNFFKKISETNLHQASDDYIFELLKKLMRVQADSVGIGHIIEAIGQRMDNELKNILAEKYDQKKVDQYFILLSAPSGLSFVAQEENDLYAIKKLPVNKRENALKKHLEKYYWIQNTYCGPAEISIRSFTKRISDAVFTSPNNFKEKEKLIGKLQLDSWAKKLTEIIELTTIWQDQRKQNILIGLSYVGYIFDELSRRLRIDPSILKHFSIVDSQNIDSISDMKKMETELKERSKGAFYLWEDKKQYIISGKEYKELVNSLREKEDSIVHDKIMGSIANGGTAIGRAVICNNISQISKVKKGDILVSSMTRPEFMPALKKAAAIITDEGGITCHAAIVSRELNIPAVIGTKIASKVLKDGMMLVVKANHGHVRVLKKK
jgi:phosphohistidine swiveling domain-containing protein